MALSAEHEAQFTFGQKSKNARQSLIINRRVLEAAEASRSGLVVTQTEELRPIVAMTYTQMMNEGSDMEEEESGGRDSRKTPATYFKWTYNHDASGTFSRNPVKTR